MAGLNLRGLRQKILPRTLFGRSLMIIATPILLLQMIVAFIFFDRHWDSISDKLVSSLAGDIVMLMEQLPSDATPSEVERTVFAAARNLGIVISFEDGNIDELPPQLSTVEKIYWFGAGTKLQAELTKRMTAPFRIAPHEKRKWFDVTVAWKPGKVVHFLCNEGRLVNVTTYIFILWLIGSAAILLGISVLFMRNQIRPIMRLAIAAEKFGKGQEVPDFKPVGAREVRQASKAFLEMRERLKRQIEQRTAMLAGVSHDLRTPLTRMKLQLAMIKDSDAAALLRQDVDEMEKMLEGYLAFAKGEGDEVPEMTDLVPVIERIIGNAKRQGYDVTEDIADSLMIKVRPVAIERALANIISNACHYAEHVTVRAQARQDMIEVQVEDDGPGIPKGLREDVFRPFYRVEKSRNKKTGGLGLGLSIARDIIHGHGGKIDLADGLGGKGLKVIVSLPL